MLDTIIGGLIALISVLVGGIFIPMINSRIQTRKIINQQLMKLSSTLYLLKNNLSNYLNKSIYIDLIGEDEAGVEEAQRLRRWSEKVNSNIDNLYQIQQELITHLNTAFSSIPIIYKKLDELDSFIWSKKIYFNNDKVIFDQESSDEYLINLNKMIEETLIPKIESLITLNQNILRTNNKNKKC